MCGRFTLRTSGKAVADFFGLPEIPALPARFNIAPTQPVPAVRVGLEHEGRDLALLRWGLIPGWADDPSIGNRMINARADTVATKPAFRKAFRQRRCLIVADGFYEWKKLNGRKQPYYIRVQDGQPFAFAGWKKLNGRKQPYYIRVQDGQPFAFAGLWERWERGDSPIDEWHVDPAFFLILGKLGSYRASPVWRLFRDLRAIRRCDQ
jgi:putative SOS response-associated peptidase YedK